MSIKYIKHQNKDILVASFNECDGHEQMMDLAVKLRDEVVGSAGGLRVLTNYEGVLLNPQFMSKVKEMGKQAQGKVVKSAVIGVSGVKKILLNAYNRYTKRNVVAFDTYQQAIDYLASD